MIKLILNLKNYKKQQYKLSVSVLNLQDRLYLFANIKTMTIIKMIALKILLVRMISKCLCLCLFHYYNVYSIYFVWFAITPVD